MARSTNRETLPIRERLSSELRKHAAQSRLLAKFLNSVRRHSVPTFFVNRAAANGLTREELESAIQAVKHWEHMPDVCTSCAEDFYEKAMYWENLGLSTRAGTYYLQSALWDFYAQLLSLNDQDSKAKIYARCAQIYRKAAINFEYPAERIEIPYLSGILTGYLRLPISASDQNDSHEFEQGGSNLHMPVREQDNYGRRANSNDDSKRFVGGHKYPVAILVNSINSTKEELHYSENAFLRMGIATFSFDLPGFGESHTESIGQCDFEILNNALYLFLAQQQNVDPTRIALYGLGEGAALALWFLLLSPDRYKAIATLSAPYNLRETLRRILPSMRREVLYLTHGAEDILRDFAERLIDARDLNRLNCPMLVAGGGRDVLAPAEDTKMIYEQAGSSDKKLILIPSARYGCYEMMPSLRYEIAQWIRERI